MTTSRPPKACAAALAKLIEEFGIAAGVGEQLHLARGLGKHGGDGIELGRGGGGVDDEAAAVVGEFARNVYAASRRKPRDKHANASKLTVVRRTRIPTHNRHQHELSLHYTPGG